MKPYVEPRERQRMAAAGGGAADDESAAPEAPQEVTAFLPKALLGDRKWNPGESITLVIKAIDPESGDAQVTTGAPEEEEEGEEPGDSMEAMDQAIPPGEEDQPGQTY